MTNEELENPIMANLAEKKFISEIEIKYCHVRQVERNSMNTLGMKCQFLRVLEQMKSKGKKVKIMSKIAYMIDHDENETFYKNKPELSAEDNEK